MTEHDRFESAYRECFPVASSMQADLFERDDDGYIEAKVHTAFTLWKAARATPSDHIGEAAEKVDAGSVPVAWIRMDHLRQAQQAPFMCRVEPEFRKGLDLAPFYLAAPQAPQPEAQSVRDAWISVDERLPEKNLVVLCGADFYAPGDWRMKIGYLDGPTSVWKLFGGSWTPTHWQPLPAPPQKPEDAS